jgi:F-type H+-transporting ATPase subunit c
MKFALSTAARAGVLLALTSSVAFAAEGNDYMSWGAGVGAGLAIGLAAIGGAFGQGRAASAALEGMARNPQAAGGLQTPFILALVFIETLTLFSLIIAMKLSGLI